ncbi:MAG: GerMN domain-containing protein [Firmicutes bacterium]|nr:GerMN domain-containing protein [Bacillota bacterium]
MERRPAPTGKRLWFIALIVILGGLLIYYLAAYLRAVEVNRDLRSKLAGVPAAVFFIKSNPAYFQLKPVIITLKNEGDLRRQALEALFAGPPEGSGLFGVFSPATKVLGISIRNGTATVNLNRAAMRINVGSETEALAIASIVNTLTKFPEIYQVKILIEGKVTESLAGHVDLTKPFKYNGQVVDPAPLVRP